MLPPIDNYKANDTNNKSNISRYDTRSFYRTYDYMGQSYYKIGKPYVPPETSCSIDCCCCCKRKKKKDGFCDCHCGSCDDEITDKRIYIDIFNMQDQMVGKFAMYVDPGSCCCSKSEFFYEVYFPPDANELLRLALIAQILFFVKLNDFYFGSLPGSSDGIEQYSEKSTLPMPRLSMPSIL